MKALTPSQEKTLAYVRAHGRIQLGTSGNKGYSAPSAEVLIRRGYLVEVEETREGIMIDGGRTRPYTYTRRYADNPED